MIGSYGKVYNLGHAAIVELLNGPVLVEEKVDGSQFSFGVDSAGELHVRSKGKAIVIDAPDKMFAAGVETAKRLAPMLTRGWVYRGEYLQKPKHNALAYDRIPTHHVAIFDISTAPEAYLDPTAKAVEAKRLGLEWVPSFHVGHVSSVDELRAPLDKVSFLGGQKIEGVVIKNYARFGVDGKVLMGKHVSEAFKEVHRHDWKESNPAARDVVQLLCEEYRSKSRWNKAIQHLRDEGRLTQSPKDIGPLILEAQRDITEECVDEIKERLWAWASKHILRGAIRGLPEWYKDQLMQAQFEDKETTQQ